MSGFGVLKVQLLILNVVDRTAGAGVFNELAYLLFEDWMTD